MAFIEDKYCYECCKEVQHCNGKCVDCECKRKTEKHKKHFANLDAMTLEFRVRLIEKQLYELNENQPWIERKY